MKKELLDLSILVANYRGMKAMVKTGSLTGDSVLAYAIRVTSGCIQDYLKYGKVTLDEYKEYVGDLLKDLETDEGVMLVGELRLNFDPRVQEPHELAACEYIVIENGGDAPAIYSSKLDCGDTLSYGCRVVPDLGVKMYFEEQSVRIVCLDPAADKNWFTKFSGKISFR